MFWMVRFDLIFLHKISSSVRHSYFLSELSDGLTGFVVPALLFNCLLPMHDISGVSCSSPGHLRCLCVAVSYCLHYWRFLNDHSTEERPGCNIKYIVVYKNIMNHTYPLVKCCLNLILIIIISMFHFQASEMSILFIVILI